MTANRSTYRKLGVFCVFVLALTMATSAQQRTAKRPLSHHDYDSWNSIQSQKLSRDGKFLAYVLTPEEGNGQLVVLNLATSSEWRVPIGMKPVQTNPDDESGAPAGPPAAQQPQVFFTHDARFVAFQISPTKEDTDKAKKDKKRPEDQPKGGLGLMDLTTGKVTALDRVRTFQVPEEGDGFIAYLKEAPVREGPAPAANRNGASNRKDYGTEFVLRNLKDQSERSFSDVIEYTLSRDAKSLVYAVSSRKEDSEGAYVFTTGGSDPQPLLTGKGKYAKLTWDEKQSQLVFLSDRDESASTQPKLKMYRWNRSETKAAEIVSPSMPNFRAGMVISDRGAISFSLDGSKVFFGVAPPERAGNVPAADSTGIDEDKPSFDLWNWQDDFIQPMQKVRANQDRNRTFRAVFSINDGKFRQLADETMETVNPSSDGRLALGADDRPYRKLVGVDTNYSDFYLVNPENGSRQPLVQKQNGGMTWSPNGRYALYYQDKNWFTVSMPDGKITNLTKGLGVNFSQEEYDSPSAPPSYGNANWTRDDKYLLINDRYDIWQLAADGSSSRNLTGGSGRKNKLIFRYVRLEQPEPGQERGIDPAKPLLLSATNEVTHDEGFYRARIEGGMPEKLMMAAKAFRNPVKAKDADVVMLTESTFNEFPDIMITTSDLKNLKKVTNGNPQKAGLLWGTAELVQYKNADGIPLSGILMKPENFDPTKKYPMIVYIYERLTQNLNSFVDPRPTNNINASYYVSNGYLVLEPDIAYTIGYPGQSALKCVLPAVQAVVDKGFVDEKNIGIQGHSWGGYQIAYMITQTNRFKAAAPGAVVANMTSAYSGVRWGTGLPRQFQYEHTQSRIGGNIWEYPMRFVENSPLFQLDRVQTPILSIANDSDDAVPWYQGIEFYLGLRRLGKEVYLFSYNGEPHNLRRRPNQKDYTLRLQQYFDHFLKGAPAPDWMTKGIPFLQKGQETGTAVPSGTSKSKGGSLD